MKSLWSNNNRQVEWMLIQTLYYFNTDSADSRREWGITLCQNQRRDCVKVCVTKMWRAPLCYVNDPRQPPSLHINLIELTWRNIFSPKINTFQKLRRDAIDSDTAAPSGNTSFGLYHSFRKESTNAFTHNNGTDVAFRGKKITHCCSVTQHLQKQPEVNLPALFCSFIVLFLSSLFCSCERMFLVEQGEVVPGWVLWRELKVNLLFQPWFMSAASNTVLSLRGLNQGFCTWTSWEPKLIIKLRYFTWFSGQTALFFQDFTVWNLRVTGNCSGPRA